MPARTLALVSDLILATKIRSTGQALGRPVEVVRTLDDLRIAAAAGGASQVIVDLDAAGLDVAAVVTAARAAGVPRVVGFLSHVNVERAQAASAAGVDEVLARSAFSANLPSLLTGA
jgi:hypothetical protein